MTKPNDRLESPDSAWYAPVHIMRLATGEYLLKTGKPVQRASLSQVSKWTGVPVKTIRRLADAGFIRRVEITPFVHRYYPADIEGLAAKTEADPNYWNEVRRAAYLGSQKKLRDKEPD